MTTALTSLFQALADPTRRRILKMLQPRDLSAGDIADEFDMSRPSISHHLRILKEAGLVAAERHGQHIIYSLNTTVAQEALAWIVELTRGGNDGED